VNRLSSWLLDAVYLVVLLVCAPLIVWKAIRTGKYREGYREKLLGLVPWREGQGTCIWIHAVSVGEVNLLATTLGRLREAHPDWQFVISTTSRAGYELARRKYADLAVFYCPLDFSWAVRTAMRRIRPAMLVLAELELWPNLIAAAKQSGARVAIINGRLSDHSFPGYRRIGPLVGRVLRQIDLIAAQNEETAQRFCALGALPDRVHVTGSLKYDGAQTERSNPRTAALRELAGIADDDSVFLAGSTQEPEEEIAIDIYRRLSAEHPQLRLILVPRHPERFDAVARLLGESRLRWVRRSELNRKRDATQRMNYSREPTARPGHAARASDDSREPTARRAPPILLIDTVGELGAWWGTAHVAFVGGSFGSRGGQNMIEPAAYGAAVSFGPNTWNFRDIVGTLLAAEAAVVVENAAALEAFVRRTLDEPEFAAALGARAQSLVRSQLGATDRTVTLLQSLLAVRCVRRSAA
jgi:3-deoxy-D-manno-octulosonic-acid transferase